MSEFIDNVSKRKETLKNILRQLHEGKSVDEVKAEFALLANEITAEEIAEVEQMLINEGMPVGEVHNLCDVHVAVMQDALERSSKTGGTPDSIPGHPLHTFKLENEAAEETLNKLHKAFQTYQAHRDAPSLANLRRQIETLLEFERHYLRKENILFPHLEKYDFYGPSQVMWQTHDEIRTLWKSMLKNIPNQPSLDDTKADEMEPTLSSLEQAIRDMFYKEEKILFPASLNLLKESDWLDIRQSEPEIGYFIVRPGNQWPPTSMPVQMIVDSFETKDSTQVNKQSRKEMDNMNSNENNVLSLNTGALTPKQIDLLLTHLPVDVTFVDENDEVRYFSQTKERIFTRTPAIIGRKVQNCHPPQSVHRVQKIVDDFRSGTRDKAEFWIEMGGKFIHISYYALHDENGTYRGTLEVSQDATHLRSLTGERRLLDGDIPGK